MSSTVLTEVVERTLVVTIDRPEARNAVDLAVAEGIAAAMDRLDDDPDLRVGVLAGSGTVFCAGMDLKAFGRGERPIVENRGFGGLVAAPPRKPLIAAVDGWALAGGFELVLSCDLVVASTQAKFGLPEVKRGLTAAAGGLFRLPRRLPYHVAMDLILTGRTLEAEEAHGYGLIARLTQPGQARTEAVALAESIAANAPLAVVASKRVATESAGWPADRAFELQEEIVDPVRRSADAREGALAFVQKRDPVWTGA